MVTVLYYTSNREPEIFEKKIRDKLLLSLGDVPVVSVSQKPFDLGKNVCVSEHYPCDANAFRQIRIGLEYVTTPYVVAAESDFLYPKEYFQYQPSSLDVCYRFQEIWILEMWGDRVFRRKAQSEGAQMVGRDYWIRRLDDVLKGRPEWAEPPRPKPDLGAANPVFDRKKCVTVKLDNPCVSIKTGYGLRKKCGVMKEIQAERALPLWGSASDMRKELRWLREI